MAETYYSLTDIVKHCDNLVAAMPTSFYSGIMTVRTGLANLPAADVVPVRHGKWENNHCSVCGMMPMGEEIWDTCEFCPPRFEYFMNYCPNCGARMDGDGE